MNKVVIRNRRDILKYLEDNPRNTPRVGILFAIALTSVFADAYDLGSLSIGVASLTNDLGLTATQVGIITSSTAIGALVSALAGGMIADRTGRYRLFIICAVLLVIAPIGVALSVNFWMVLFFRVVLGIAVGLDIPVAFSFMAELLTKETSAKFINFWQPVSSFSNILGVAIALPFALGAVTSGIWRYTVGFGAVIALVALVLRLKYSEESPLWSAKHQNLIKAAKVLETTYDIKVQLEPDGTDDQEIDPSRRRYGLSLLFEIGQLPKTVLVSVCSFCQQLQYYGIGFYVPLIAGMVFGHDLVSTIIATICAQAVAMIAGLIGVRLTSRLGLRQLGLIGYSIVLVSLLWMSFIGVDSDHPSLLPIVLVCLMLAGTAFGPGPLSKTLAAVVYPTEIRGMGTGWSETMGRAGSIIGLFFFPVVLAAVGVQTTMLIISVFPILAIVSLITVHWGNKSERKPQELTVVAG
ncbi:MAG: MFS transporter [Galactobacter sp.]